MCRLFRHLLAGKLTFQIDPTLQAAKAIDIHGQAIFGEFTITEDRKIEILFETDKRFLVSSE